MILVKRQFRSARLASASPRLRLAGHGSPGVVLADWSDASRATRYRVFKQVLTVDANFVAADTVNDSDYTLSGLPSGKTVRVQIVSANDAGQGQPSAVVEIVVP
jgi:hypothetical protein